MMRLKQTAMAMLMASLLGACTTHIQDKVSPTLADGHKEDLKLWEQSMNAPRNENVRITDMPIAGERVDFEKHAWLRKKKVTVNIAKGGSVSAHAIAQMLKDNGVQVMSSLPLHSYQYNGFGVRNVDAYTAMRLLFAPMGLDFSINDEDEYVVITPNKARTFYVKLGQRTAEYESGTISGNMGDIDSSSSSSSSSSSMSDNGIASSVETGLSTGTGRIRIESDFWGSIDKELEKLLVQCVPTTTVTSLGVGSPADLPALVQSGLTGLPSAIAPLAGGSSSSEICKEEKIGNYSLNPATGAITVQAPHWVLDSVARYIDTIKQDNSVTLIYEGLLISVTSSREKSEGIDLQGFASFASGKWGLSVANNALGGVTVTGGIPAATDAIGDTLFGAVKQTGNPAQVFLAYLEANANYSIKQKPRVTATNGMPGEFGQYDTMYFTQIVQETTSGSEANGLVGTQNRMIPFKVGALLRIVPYYDSDTGLVRSPITFTQSVQTGVYETKQYITAGNTIQAIPSTIPLIRDSNYSGEVLMRDGDMIIIGGQVSETSESAGSGLPGYNNAGNWLSGLMGQKRHKDEVSTYYLALTLRVQK